MRLPGPISEVATRVDDVLSRAARKLTGQDLRLSARPTVAALKRGRFGNVELRMASLDVGGIRLASLHLRAADVGIRPALPPRLVAGGADVSVRVEQRAVDRWARSLGLPARLVIRPSKLVARLGVAGLRLGQIDMEVSVAPEGIRLAPRRFATLGIDVRTEDGLDVVIPLPALPAGAVLTSVEWGDGVGDLTLHVTDVAVPVGLDDIRRARALAAKMGRRDNAPERLDPQPEQVLDVSSRSRERRPALPG